MLGYMIVDCLCEGAMVFLCCLACTLLAIVAHKQHSWLVSLNSWHHNNFFLKRSIKRYESESTRRNFDKILKYKHFNMCSFIVLKIKVNAVLHWGLNLLLLWQGWWYRKGKIHFDMLNFGFPIFVVLGLCLNNYSITYIDDFCMQVPNYHVYVCSFLSRKSISLPLKWFTVGQCWRYERMTRGRRREHYQWNMDIIGVPGVMVCAACYTHFLK